jgi:hypothetical protein
MAGESPITAQMRIEPQNSRFLAAILRPQRSELIIVMMATTTGGGPIPDPSEE